MMNLKAVVSEPKDTKEESPNVQAPLPGVTLIPNTQQLWWLRSSQYRINIELLLYGWSLGVYEAQPVATSF